MTVDVKKKVWTYREASKAIPYVRVILSSLRVSYIVAWHMYRLSKTSDATHEVREDASTRRQEAIETLDELHRLGAFVYQHPARGIALFPFSVQVIESAALKSYYVLKDTREGIDSFIFHDELCENNDLYQDEKPVPDQWRVAGAIPKLEEVKP